MRDELADRGHAQTNSALTVVPLEASVAVARLFGEQFIDGDAVFSLRRDSDQIATIRLNVREATLRALPATGLLLDVSDPLPERLLDPIADQLLVTPTQDNPIVHGPFSLGALVGTITHVGASEAYKPDLYQVKLDR